MNKNNSDMFFASYACLNSKKGRLIKEFDRYNKNEYLRSDFQRDRDRIIHSAAFRKLKHKTQVFVYHEGDYFRTRLTHSLEVSQIARTICRSLNLNEDLAESISLAHDLGHPPFGHAGEEALNKVMNCFGGFDHNEQTLRVLTLLEERYANFNGLNLTFETLEGIIKHNGPLKNNKIRETIKKLNNQCDFKLSLHASLEAQVANMSDDIAYLSHDFDDGIRAKLISIDQIKNLPLVGEILFNLEKKYGKISKGRLTHELTRNIINFFVQDIIKTSSISIKEYKPKTVEEVRNSKFSLILHSEGVIDILNQLKNFLFKNCWKHFKVNRMMDKSKNLLENLFHKFLDDTNLLPTEWQLKIIKNVQTNDQKARIIADYIASMTDRYAILESNRLFNNGPAISKNEYY